MTPRTAAITLSLALLATGPALAQAPAAPPGSIAGVVVEAATQKPIAEVTLAARSPSLPGEQAVVTEPDGSFEMTMLPPGTYRLAVRREGFEPFDAELPVREGRARVRIFLVPEKGSAPPPPPPPPSKETAVEFNEAMSPPELVSGPNPAYTAEAIDREIEGTMRVRCVVTLAGTVRSCNVLRSLPFMNDAVVYALERRRYKPATLQGKPIEVFYTFTLKLALPRN